MHIFVSFYCFAYPIIGIIFQENTSYIDMVTDSWNHLQHGETWTNFGLYLINNTALVTPMELIIDFSNKSMYDASGEMV